MNSESNKAKSCGKKLEMKPADPEGEGSPKHLGRENANDGREEAEE